MVEKILVVDDDASLRRVLEYNLAKEGYAVLTADSGEKALALLEAERVDLLITDIKMPGMDGMDLLRRVRQASPETQVIVITAFGTIEMAVEAMKAGAFEYVTKPFNRDELSLAVRKALRLRSLEHDNARLRREVEKKYGFANIVGDSPLLQQVFRLIEKVADSDASVLITGESGTGKELVAKAIHFRSLRADRPFVAVNCAAIPRELLESELFGHKKGAFTGAVRDKMGRFEEAGSGTLLLDEIADLPVELQAKLLRALQEREFTPVGGSGVTRFEARVIAATNRDLEGDVAEGRFREDLFYRLAVVPIHLPSLRERPEDIPLLVAHFLRTLGGGQEGHGQPRGDGRPQAPPLEGQRARAREQRRAAARARRLRRHPPRGPAGEDPRAAPGRARPGRRRLLVHLPRGGGVPGGSRKGHHPGGAAQKRLEPDPRRPAAEGAPAPAPLPDGKIRAAAQATGECAGQRALPSGE